MASAGVARPPAVSAREIHEWAAGPPGLCTRMATSRLRTRSLARQELMTPVSVGSSGPICSIGRYRSGRPTVVDVIDAADPPVPLRGPAAGCPGPDVASCGVTSAAAEPGPDRSQGFPE